MCPHKGKKHRCCIEIRARKDNARRAVAFLHHDEINYVNVTDMFDSLPEEIGDTFQRRFDNWIRDLPGSSISRHQYHGWNKSQYDGKYTKCWVFKAPGNRLYGFLCHPKAPLDKGYELCVLVLHDSKHAHETYEPNLKHAEALRINEDVQKAIKGEFSVQTREPEKGKKRDKRKGKRR